MQVIETPSIRVHHVRASVETEPVVWQVLYSIAPRGQIGKEGEDIQSDLETWCVRLGARRCQSGNDERLCTVGGRHEWNM
jgi:hypothetical protein